MASLRIIKPCPSSKNAYFQNKAKFKTFESEFYLQESKKSFSFPLKQRRQATLLGNGLFIKGVLVWEKRVGVKSGGTVLKRSYKWG